MCCPIPHLGRLRACLLSWGPWLRTGALSFIAAAKEDMQKTPIRHGLLLLIVVVGSADNTPVVVVCDPRLHSIGEKARGHPGQPLFDRAVYAAIMGRTLTLIEHPNLLVDGVANLLRVRTVFNFEVTPIGLVVVSWGAVYLYFLGPLLLPKRDSLASLLTDKSRMKFLEAGSFPWINLIGREVTSVQLFKRDGVRLIDVVRKEGRCAVT